MIYAAFDMSNIFHICLHTKWQADKYAEDPYPVMSSAMVKIFKFVQDMKVDVPLFVFDSKFTYKKMIYRNLYKEGRYDSETNENKIRRIDALHQLSVFRTIVMPAAGIEHLRIHQTGYEADDMMALLANKYKEKLYIVSSDTDFYQLLDRASRVYNPTNNLWQDKYTLFMERHVRPENWAMYRSLVGKNKEIKGVPSIGHKTASRYLAGWGISAKAEQKIKDAKELIDMNMRISELPFRCKPPLRELRDEFIGIKDEVRLMKALNHYAPQSTRKVHFLGRIRAQERLSL